MPQGLSPFIKSLVMVIIGALCIVSFAFYFIQETNPSSEIFDDKYGMNDSINLMQDNLEGFKSVADDASIRLSKAKPSPIDFIFLIFLGAFEIPILFLSFVGTGVGAVINVFLTMIRVGAGQVAGFSQQIGGLLALIAGVISAVLIFTVVLLIIKNIRSGQD